MSADLVLARWNELLAALANQRALLDAARFVRRYPDADRELFDHAEIELSTTPSFPLLGLAGGSYVVAHRALSRAPFFDKLFAVSALSSELAGGRAVGGEGAAAPTGGYNTSGRRDFFKVAAHKLKTRTPWRGTHLDLIHFARSGARQAMAVVVPVVVVYVGGLVATRRMVVCSMRMSKL